MSVVLQVMNMQHLMGSVEYQNQLARQRRTKGIDSPLRSPGHMPLPLPRDATGTGTGMGTGGGNVALGDMGRSDSAQSNTSEGATGISAAERASRGRLGGRRGAFAAQPGAQGLMFCFVVSS